jgi:hypothetical protein
MEEEENEEEEKNKNKGKKEKNKKFPYSGQIRITAVLTHICNFIWKQNYSIIINIWPHILVNTFLIYKSSLMIDFLRTSYHHSIFKEHLLWLGRLQKVMFESFPFFLYFVKVQFQLRVLET